MHVADIELFADSANWDSKPVDKVRDYLNTRLAAYCDNGACTLLPYEKRVRDSNRDYCGHRVNAKMTDVWCRCGFALLWKRV